jgi:thiaminase
MKSLKAKVEESEMHNKVHETYAQEEVKKLVPKVLANLEQLYSSTKQPRLSTPEMVAQIKQWESEFTEIS